MIIQRKIYHLLGDNGIIGRDFRYFRTMNPRHTFDWGNPIWITDKIDGTTTQASFIDVFQRRDRFKKGSPEKIKASPDERYYIQKLDEWDPANKWIFEACRRYLPIFEERMPSTYTAYFECFGEKIQARYRGMNSHDIRVFDFTDCDYFLDDFKEVADYAEMLDLPVVGHISRTFKGVEDVIAELSDATHIDPKLERFDLEGWVLRQGDQIAKIRKSDLKKIG